MKNIVPIFIVAVIIGGLVFFLYRQITRSRGQQGSEATAPGQLSSTSLGSLGADDLKGQISAETLAKIEIACMASSSKAWFEDTYKTKCSSFGF